MLVLQKYVQNNAVEQTRRLGTSMTAIFSCPWGKDGLPSPRVLPKQIGVDDRCGASCKSREPGKNGLLLRMLSFVRTHFSTSNAAYQSKRHGCIERIFRILSQAASARSRRR